MSAGKRKIRKALDSFEMPSGDRGKKYTDTIIAGPREVHSLGHVAKAMIAARAIAPGHFGVEGAEGSKPLRIVSGTAEGVDRTGERWAGLAGVPVRQFPAIWSTSPIHTDSAGDPSNRETTKIQSRRVASEGTFSASAGPERNARMGTVGDALVAILDEGARSGDRHTAGTLDMIKSAKAKRIPILIRHVGPLPEANVPIRDGQAYAINQSTGALTYERLARENNSPTFVHHEYIDSNGHSTIFGEVAQHISDNIDDAFSSAGEPRAQYARLGSMFVPSGFALGDKHLDYLHERAMEARQRTPERQAFFSYDAGPDFEGYRHGGDYAERKDGLPDEIPRVPFGDRGIFAGFRREADPLGNQGKDNHVFIDHPYDQSTPKREGTSDPFFILLHRVAVQHVLNGGRFGEISDDASSFDPVLRGKLQAAAKFAENHAAGLSDDFTWGSLNTPAPSMSDLQPGHSTSLPHQLVDRNNPATINIQHVFGNIFANRGNPVHDVIVNTCNTQGTLGKGLAAAFKYEYRDTDYEEAYRALCFNDEAPISRFRDPDGFATQQERLRSYREALAGTVWLHQPKSLATGSPVGPKIASAFVKDHFNGATRRSWLDSCVEDLKSKVESDPDLASLTQGVRIGMPIMGGTNGMTGHASMDTPLWDSENWPRTQAKVEQVFGPTSHQVDIMRPLGDTKDYWAELPQRPRVLGSEDLRQVANDALAKIFNSYAENNKPSAFARELKETGLRTPAEINLVHAKIRSHHVGELTGRHPRIFGQNTRIDPYDASTLLVDPALTERFRLLETGFKRIVVGDHGIYVEFDPANRLGQKGRFVKRHLHYDEYSRPIIGSTIPSKVYDQKKKVNYADYKPGMCYVPIADYIGRLSHSTPSVGNTAPPPRTGGRRTRLGGGSSAPPPPATII